jgi:hypothetical protein
MEKIKIKTATVLLAYGYWPLFYFAVYLPLIVPKLDHWKHIPLWIFLASVFGFIVLLAGVGAKHKTKTNFFHAIGIAASLYLFQFLLKSLSLPGFRKPGFSDILASFLSILVVFILLETGRMLLPKRTH